MFIDSRQFTDGQRLQADVCIVGAGAAGISIAREFAGTSSSVILLESGGFEFEPRTQSLYSGDNTGLETFDLDVNRLRYFGGTTNHWAGHSRPLDTIDLEQKDWLPGSGWPISRQQLDPYYLRAQPILELGEFEYDDLAGLEQLTGLPALKTEPSRLQSVVYGQSPPTRFGEKYRQQLDDAPNIRVCLFANALELLTGDNGQLIETIQAGCIDGPRFAIKATQVVLAMGGMENARILLLSGKASAAGLGNNHDLVGRYFMDHILLRPGVDISFTHPGLNLGLYHRLHGAFGGKRFAVLAASEELLRREQMANFRVHLVTAGPRYALPIGGIFSNLDGFAGPNPLEKARDNSISMHMVLEPAPNRDSRIRLSDKLDLFGQRKMAVNWQITPADLKHAHRAMELVALEFGRMGLGRGYGAILQDPSVWPANLEAGKHHCGTTRMADNPETGVVDGDCKVFGIGNLYIAGSSVFTTIGFANPTLTIVALALRLSDHLKDRLS